MASTYSQLKIELIGTGDQAGTWGTTTNVNLGTALEEAITGSANVTFAGSNVAIALTDTNASQVARNLELNLVGSITNRQTLFIPAIEKQYLIVNNLSNSVVISNGTNASPTGVTVTIPAGRNMAVYNDSINVAEVINYITELAVSNVTVTNSVNVASVNVSNVTVTNTANIATLNLTNALSVASGGTGRATLTANNVVLGNGTTAVNFVGPGASGNVLTSNGTTWVSQAPAASGITTGKSIAMALIFGF